MPKTAQDREAEWKKKRDDYEAFRQKSLREREFRKVVAQSWESNMRGTTNYYLKNGTPKDKAVAAKKLSAAQFKRKQESKKK